MELQVQVEKTSNIHRKLKIRVPAKIVSARFNEGLQELSKTVKLKGFRQGNVPLTVVRQYYGNDLRHQLFHDLIDESFREALKTEQLRAVGRPQIETPDHKTGAGEHDHSLSEEKDLSFIATVEVLPEIEVKGYTGIALTREKTDVSDEDVTKVVDGIRGNQAELRPIGGGLALADGTAHTRPAEKGDFVDMKFSGGLVTDTGVEKKAGMDGSRLLEIGSGEFIPGFEDQLIGMRGGETKTFRITFPKEYHAEFAEKVAEFTVTVEGLKEKILPELNDELAKTMGYETLAEMKEKAREHLVREKAQESERKLRSDLLAALIEKNPFDCPAALIEAQTRSLMQEVVRNLQGQGFTDEMVGQAIQAEGEGLRKKAENQVRSSLLLETIFKKENLKVTEDDVASEIAKMSQSMSVDIERLKEFYEKNPARREDLEFRVKEDRAVAFLFEKAKIKTA